MEDLSGKLSSLFKHGHHHFILKKFSFFVSLTKWIRVMEDTHSQNKKEFYIYFFGRKRKVF